LKEEIKEYVKPESPKLTNAKVQSVQIVEDEQIKKVPQSKLAL
jgi:hypothetical protein